MLCIPMMLRGGMHPRTVASLWAMRHHLPDKDLMITMFPTDRPTAGARSDALRAAQEWDVDSLLFIDSDMEFQPDLYERLKAIDGDIVCGLFHNKRVPSYTTICKKEKHPTNGTDILVPIPVDGKVQEVDACGMAATLIRRPVLEWATYPAFKHLGWISEDYEFCLQAREAGFTIRCDTSLRVAHRGDIAFNGQPVLSYPGMEDLSVPFGYAGEGSRLEAV